MLVSKRILFYWWQQINTKNKIIKILAMFLWKKANKKNKKNKTRAIIVYACLIGGTLPWCATKKNQQQQKSNRIIVIEEILSKNKRRKDSDKHWLQKYWRLSGLEQLNPLQRLYNRTFSANYNPLSWVNKFFYWFGQQDKVQFRSLYSGGLHFLK